MLVNTRIVKALLTLRNIAPASLCAVTGISPEALSAWLSSEGADAEADDRLSFQRQLEVLKVLGVAGEHPRSDITHHWRIREPLFNAQEAYEPLKLMLQCFGRAEIVYLSPEQDTWAAWGARTFFGLTFTKFRAVLEIQSSAFRALAFDPSSLPNLSWAGTGAAMVLEQAKFKQLTSPGESTPVAFDKERAVALEHLQWDKLARLAAECDMSAVQIAGLLAEHGPKALEKKTRGRSRRAARQKETPVAPTSEAETPPSAAEKSAPASAD